MSFSQGSRAGLSYVVESTFGTTPGTPSLIQLPYTTHSLNLSKERVTGNDIQPDRMLRVDRHGNRSVAGDISVDLRKGDYDPFFESAFFNTFSTNTLKIGTTPKYFSIEDAATDITQFRLFTGMAVSSMAISIRPNQMVTATMSMVGKDMTISGTSVDAVKTASSTNAPFDAYSGALSIGNAGGSLSASAIITGIDFTINNSLAPTFVVGSASTPQLEYGMASVEGTITAYFENATLINRFINETESGIEVSVDDPTGSSDYTFLFPRVKINGADVPVDGPTSRVITLPFVALYDTTEASNIVLTRSV
jgi:microcystin-dependent protein